MQTFTIGSLNVMAVGGNNARICYLLYPLDFLGEWIEQAALTYNISIAVITNMDWDDDLTPWQASGQPPGCPDFRGNARQFLSTLTGEVLPEIERRLGISSVAERTLAGVSLSGLFTLWQWMQCDEFHNIISLSGSFWYPGFVEWIKSHKEINKSGRAYFLLGDRESKSRVRAFRPVQTDTMQIVDYLRAKSVNECFELVPGDHYQFAEERLDRAFSWMFLPNAVGTVREH